MKQVYRAILHLTLLSALIFALSSCSNTKHLGEQEALLKKNRIVLETDANRQTRIRLMTGLETMHRIKPNKKMTGLFNMRLWFYNTANRKRETKFRWWIKNKVGEPPALLDSSAVIRTMTHMDNFLQNKGFLYSKVAYSVEIKKKRAEVTYLLETGSVYRFNKIHFPIDSGRVAHLVRYSKNESLLKPGDPFDTETLNKERDRITADLRNQGYFQFNKAYVFFDLDSNNKERNMDVHIRIKNPTDSTEHLLFFLDSIYIFTEYSLEKPGPKHPGFDTMRIAEFVIVRGKVKYRRAIILSSVFLRRGKVYSRAEEQLTINRLSDMGVFKFINVRFQPKFSQGRNLLDAYIYLTPGKKQEMGISVEANNATDYDLGSAVTYTYINKNLFRSADLMTFNFTAGLESQFSQSSSFFNTMEFNPDINFTFNRFLLPFQALKYNRKGNPRTVISMKYNYLKRIEYYTIQSTNLSLGYDWRESRTKRHLLYPLNLTVSRLIPEPQYEDILNLSPTIRKSFGENFIIGQIYTFINTNSELRPNRSSFFLKTNLDFAGNMLHGANALAGLFMDRKPPYRIFSIQYAQYAKGSADARFYQPIGMKTRLAMRMEAGLGVPYGNSETLPYIKQFFGGGSNSIRAWRIRTLGPGSYNYFDYVRSDPSLTFFFDQTGDMKIELNLEFRFDLFWVLKGAIFADLGNVWLLKKDPARPGAEFNIAKFWDEFAIGSGGGIRLDFSFFVISLDMGVKVRDPAFSDSPWVITKVSDREFREEYRRVAGIRYFPNFNLAIGYPF